MVRFYWTLLTQLVCDVANILSRLLLYLIGPITKFILYITYDTELDVEHNNHWVMFWSRKGIVDFTLLNSPETKLMLSSHLSSCLELKHLKLDRCCLRPPRNFHGFPNLLSLDLYEVTDINNFKFITKCPLLEILIIRAPKRIGKVKLVEIAKLKNLRVLSLSLCILDVAIKSSTIFQLGGYLPKLQELTLGFNKCTFHGEAGVRKWVHTAFPCLKTLTLYPIEFGNARMLSFAFEMIWFSPNLQTLEISATYNGDPVPPPTFSFPELDNNTKLQLQNVYFSCFRGSENEVYLIKSLLACSPLLQSITIHAKSSQMFGGDNGMLNFATKLLAIDRASPKAKVKLY